MTEKTCKWKVAGGPLIFRAIFVGRVSSKCWTLSTHAIPVILLYHTWYICKYIDVPNGSLSVRPDYECIFPLISMYYMDITYIWALIGIYLCNTNLYVSVFTVSMGHLLFVCTVCQCFGDGELVAEGIARSRGWNESSLAVSVSMPVQRIRTGWCFSIISTTRWIWAYGHIIWASCLLACDAVVVYGLGLHVYIMFAWHQTTRPLMYECVQIPVIFRRWFYVSIAYQ